ncbi:hypothetical protein HPB50_002114 [Hyalomma asiaticum]|uniref:Uncharacterized protein n=1 Tax=Hyalomma asiaticum TaxID=266040 RepID=A0ACB7TAR0_HYAAI|nr:hypothetical protein HPB50_002114 [Hyalomma asiaticum]
MSRDTRTENMISNAKSELTMSGSSDLGESEHVNTVADPRMPRETCRLQHSSRSIIDKPTDEPEDVPPEEALSNAKELFEEAERPREPVRASEHVSLAASTGRRLVSALEVNTLTFDPEEFAERVRDYVSDTSQTGPLTEKAWAELGKLAEGKMKTSNPFWYAYGSAGDVQIKTSQAQSRKAPHAGRPGQGAHRP